MINNKHSNGLSSSTRSSRIEPNLDTAAIGLEDERAYAQTNCDRLIAELPGRLLESKSNFLDRMNQVKTSPMKKLEILYSFMKEFYKFVSGYTACGKGCGHCCRNLVNISDIEIDYIVKHTKKKRLKHYLPKQDFHGTPCPFLVNESCSIYEFRPYECRRHGAYTKTNHWCHPDRSNSEMIPNLRFDDIDNAFHRLRYESGPFEGYDIRQVFGRSKMKGSQSRVVLFDKKSQDKIG